MNLSPQQNNNLILKKMPAKQQKPRVVTGKKSEPKAKKQGPANKASQSSARKKKAY